MEYLILGFNLRVKVAYLKGVVAVVSALGVPMVMGAMNLENSEECYRMWVMANETVVGE